MPDLKAKSPDALIWQLEVYLSLREMNAKKDGESRINLRIVRSYFTGDVESRRFFDHGAPCAAEGSQSSRRYYISDSSTVHGVPKGSRNTDIARSSPSSIPPAIPFVSIRFILCDCQSILT